MLDLRTIAGALGGEVACGQVIAPGPGHSPRDRSMTVRLSADSPDGFICFSHAGDDFRDCRDHVRSRLGLDPNGWKRKDGVSAQVAPKPNRVAQLGQPSTDKGTGKAEAGAIWRASVDPRGTIAERYLNSRGLELPYELAGKVLRWNARINALVALFRNVHTGDTQAITRIYLDRDGRKINRKFLGPVREAAVMLDDHAAPTYGIHIGEGVETCMAGRQLGFKPAWAVGSAGAIGSFPLLACINSVTAFAETDDHGANAREIEKLAARWQAAGREVLVVTPEIGGDMNDVLQGRRA
jgi:putative DNA primase/helicase